MGVGSCAGLAERGPGAALPGMSPCASCSYDAMNYIYLSEFPSQSPIKYFVQSYRGDLVWVTESEEVWRPDGMQPHPRTPGFQAQPWLRAAKLTRPSVSPSVTWEQLGPQFFCGQVEEEGWGLPGLVGAPQGPADLRDGGCPRRSGSRWKAAQSSGGYIPRKLGAPTPRCSS